MPENFSSQMADMIAKARPPQAPGGGKVGFVGGGGAGGGIMNQAHQQMMTANVDIGAIAKMIGLKPDATWNKLTDQMAEAVERMDQKDPSGKLSKDYLSNPSNQRFLADASKKGFTKAYFDSDSGMYKLAGGKKDYQPTEAAVAGGMFGQGPRANLTGYKQAEKAPWELGVMSQEQINRLIQSKVGQSEANVAHTVAQTGEVANKARYYGTEADVLPSKVASEIGLHGAQAEYYKKHGDSLVNQGDKDQQVYNKQSMGDFSKLSKVALGDIYSDIQTTTRWPKVNKLGSLVVGHIAQLKAINKGDAGLAAGPAAEYVNQVSQELQGMKLPEKGFWSPTEAVTTSDEVKQAKIFLNDSTRIIQEMGSATPKPLQSQLIGNVVEIAKRIPLTDDLKPVMMKWLLTAAVSKDEAGLKGLADVIKQRAPKWLEQPMGTGQPAGQQEGVE